MKPHIYAELIKAWADGAEIEIKHNGKWIDAGTQITWHECNEYRLKPQPKPDVVYYINARIVNNGLSIHCSNNPDSIIETDLRIIFDGETNKLKEVEIL